NRRPAPTRPHMQRPAATPMVTITIMVMVLVIVMVMAKVTFTVMVTVMPTITTMRTTSMRTTIPPTAMAEPLALLRLLQLPSPALPIGAFNYPQGLEYANDAGWVQDERQAGEWILGTARQGLAGI